jgi:2-haloacid dehalogenase
MLYSTLLSHVHAKLASQLSVPTTTELDTAFGLSVRQWKPFPDTCAALARLSKYYKLVVLSNVDKETFGYTQKVLESEGGAFGLVVTAQDVGSYKPDERNFRHVLREIEEKFGVGKGEVLVTAQVSQSFCVSAVVNSSFQSLRHDHEPANKLGLSSSYIARESKCGTNAIGKILNILPDAFTGRGHQARYTFTFPTLGAMADAVERV